MARATKASLTGRKCKMPALARRTSGEALMTQRSATAEIVVEIVDSHLNGRNLVLVQEVKKLAAL